MADFPVTGAAAYIQYDFEAAATYGTLAIGTFKAFGHGQSISVDRTMNMRRIYGLGDVDAKDTVAGLFEGRLRIDFLLASTYFLKAVMGAVADTDNLTYGYDHTYSDNTGHTVTSISVENGIDLDTDSLFKYLGCVVERCVIRGAVGEPVTVSLDLVYAEETKATIGLDATPAADAEEPMVFSEGSVDLPSGTTLARVQSFELEIVRNPRLIAGLGDRCPSKAVWQERQWNFRMDISYENANLIEDMYGQATGPLTATNPAGEASLVLTFSNAGATTARRSLIFTMARTHIVSDTLPQRIEEHLVQSVSGWCEDYTSIVGIDNTAATP